MLTAFAVSVVFLISYIVYHLHVGSVHYPRTGVLRMIYLSDSDHPHDTRRNRSRSGDHDAAARVEGRLQAPSQDRQVDVPYLAVRERYGRGGLFDAVSVLSVQ